jgi:hypothetical protein
MRIVSISVASAAVMRGQQQGATWMGCCAVRDSSSISARNSTNGRR